MNDALKPRDIAFLNAFNKGEGFTSQDRPTPPLDPERKKLVERLRSGSTDGFQTWNAMCNAAANRIEAQAAEIARLNALVDIGAEMLIERIGQRDKAEAALAERDKEIAALREALGLFLKLMADDSYDFGELCEEFVPIARAALERSAG